MVRIERVLIRCDNQYCGDTITYNTTTQVWMGNRFYQYDGHYNTIYPPHPAGDYCDDCMEEVYSLAGEPSQEEFGSHLKEII